jgi:U32 family peptidase
MTQTNPKLELLAPAGNFEKLEIAVHYGADAVYLGGQAFSLRNFSGNFSLPEMEKALHYAHSHNVKVYVALNVYARSDEFAEIEHYLKDLGQMGIDGLIVADPGVVASARALLPDVSLHLSTQANTVNERSVTFWEKQGISRVNVARELTLPEIAAISNDTSVQIEAFVHGAMCMAYSGRCLLSSFLAKRHSNRGECTQPCRWKYALVEEKRPGQYLPINEDERGAYILNARDLCMIEHIPAMAAAGIGTFKIEGRMKGINYLASVVKVYREAIDSYQNNPDGYVVQPNWMAELAKISSRGYSTGFYFDDPDQVVSNYDQEAYAPEYRLAAKIIEASNPTHALWGVRNKIQINDPVQILSPHGPSRTDQIKTITDNDGNPVLVAQPGSQAKVQLTHTVSPNDLIRTIQVQP